MSPHPLKEELLAAVIFVLLVAFLILSPWLLGL